jgi:hypothetical protein
MKASEVLKSATTESISWLELLKHGAKPFVPQAEVQYIPPSITPSITSGITPSITPPNASPSQFSDRFQPLMKILASFGGYQVFYNMRLLFQKLTNARLSGLTWGILFPMINLDTLN